MKARLIYLAGHNEMSGCADTVLSHSKSNTPYVFVWCMSVKGLSFHKVASSLVTLVGLLVTNSSLTGCT